MNEPRIAGFDFLELIKSMSYRTGLSHERCRRICADLSNEQLARLGELVKHPSRDGEIDDLLGMRAFSI